MPRPFLAGDLLHNVPSSSNVIKKTLICLVASDSNSFNFQYPVWAIRSLSVTLLDKTAMTLSVLGLNYNVNIW